jgi:putative membrane protein
MAILSMVLVGLVAVEHIYILFLEMFMWTKPKTKSIFGIDDDLAEKSIAMAANQGLYNGFLAVGLIWGLVNNNAQTGYQFQVFFLLCVIVAAIYGSKTVKRSILFVQGVPAFLAFISVLVVNGFHYSI